MIELFYRHTHESVRHLLAAELHVNVVSAGLGEQVEDVEEAVFLNDFGLNETANENRQRANWVEKFIFVSYFPFCDLIRQVTFPSPASRASTVRRFFFPKITFSAALLTNLHLLASPDGADWRTNGEPSISFPA